MKMSQNEKPIRFFFKILTVMKFLFFMSAFTLLYANSVLSQQLNFKMKNASIDQILLKISQEVKHDLIYDSKIFAGQKKIDVDFKQTTVKQALTQLFFKTPFVFELKNDVIVVRKASSQPSIENHGNVVQQKVTGTVKDESGIALNAVTVSVVNTSTATKTDANGNFELTVPSGSSSLRFSLLGYADQEIAINNRSSISVTLATSVSDIDEVVVVGYGTQKKVNLTGSVAQVSSKDLLKRNASNTSVALQGLIPGVSVSTTSGRPGSDGAGIKIRGTGSLNSENSPLVLIDGVEGYMNYLDPNSIESVTVLKDAASASIYGSRASNGVILVTTKRGSEDALRINYSGFVGTNMPTNFPDPVSAIEYMEAINVARANNNQTPQYSDDIINTYKTQGADNFNFYDANWKDLLVKNNALTHNNSLSFSGGSKRIRTFANFAHYSQDGNLPNNKYTRSTLKLNNDFTMTTWLRGGIDLNIRQSKSTAPAGDTPESIFNKVTTFVPVFSAINSDGTWGYGQNGDNPIASAKASGLSSSTTPELAIKGFLSLTPLKGLEIYTNYSQNRLETKSDQFLKPYDTFETGVYKVTYPTTGNDKSESWGQTIINQFNLQASYERNLGSHYVKLLGGMQTEELLGRSFAAGRKFFKYDGFEDLNNGDVLSSTNSGSHYEWAMLSYYGRLNYNFKERYLLELNSRFDASTRFKGKNQWGYFPSVSAGWRISEEPFFQPIKSSINDLKLRGSMGTLGNQAIGSFYPYAASIYAGQGYWFDYNQGSGVAQTEVANENISWEKSRQFNIGLDAQLLNSRLGLTVDVFRRKTFDMLQRFPIASYIGLTPPWENRGDIENKGWEVSATWKDNVNDFNYAITANVSDIRNKVLNLYGNEYIGSNTISKEGESLNSYYGYVSNGLFQTQEEIDNSAVYGTKANTKPGYVRYVDLSGPDAVPDGIIDNHDRTILGSNMPRYEYSLNLSAEWKGFDLTLFFQGIGKKDLFYTGSGVRPFLVGRSMFKYQLDYWSEENRDAEFPILLIDGSGNNPNNIASDFWMKSGAFLRLKNLTFGYTLPKAWTQRMQTKEFRLYFNAQNLFTFSNAYEGYDPENAVSGGSFYPLMKTFTFGLNVNF
ncbi:SusC/RagA family TonB-linked outer membrane protein [Sphingobacterium sp. DK4209]|uniref:SusC/RagA family TonB-linked outer membrane protein n=1 Tax=Sphingobacterium zhuxiongii TaxID=2662364 RepID=A0A5Q0QH67_9SPHI|nr:MULTISPECIES: TonB-dependent receptor [unclassified Sphingobacterium]MVZ65474.1 SusC/RagA family TonB-linked outer membrane protein [Sphingobacterium sp. DK4209]QGA27378.1 SusC/RagA family TonB-linked outer membrane protein [Sphingobacterium sp. dk4302]